MSKSGWKLEILERDCYKCQKCGTTKNLTVHHMLPVARKGKSNKENCTCLCQQCHREYHKQWGLRQSDRYGNPIDDFTRPDKKTKKRKHRR